jgi:Protein of unknown function (DUF1549)/Protein of unknown function (DUF1553)/Planctomycete cytochrome C
MKSLAPGVLLFCLVAQSVHAASTPEVRFNRDIRPILSNRCFKCHGPDLKKGGLNLQNRETALKPRGKRGPAIVPGKAGESRLIERITAKDESERMPPKGAPLTPQQISTLRSWIDQGAKYEEHWAYVKPVRPPYPAVKNKEWARNGIDHFVLARLEAEGLSPAPEAERAILIRRVSLDLTGLPPSVGEVDAFVKDTGPDAYEKAVDRLLRSPHYGEHQARAWLDYARYADTNGYEKDQRRTAWSYRDWVIDAFNRDLPFDQFTIEQLAGDLLPAATLEQQIATGFHRNTMTNTEGGTDDEEFRVAAVVDRINTTMEVWMGTTIGCAQCHNHKFDPFSQKEYYQLFAFLNSTEDRGRSLPPTVKVPLDALLTHRQLKARIDLLTAALTEGPALVRGPLAGPLREHINDLRRQAASLKPTTALVMKELSSPRITHILIRGNHKKQGDRVEPGTPARLHPMKPGLPRNRLGLAKWLVDPDNPLVGRVTMNRLWARIFGTGIVETSEEFGAQGELPTHPELLDYLATEFVASPRPGIRPGGGPEGTGARTGGKGAGWSLKAMHRLIVTSATYRQSSRVTPDLVARDPFNRLFARGPRVRLTAEMVRDNALGISGLLDRKLGGPSVFPHQPDGVWFNPYSNDRWMTSTGGDRFRRGLYTFWRRTAPYAMFMAFDAPSREVTCERRPRTNTPLQALATLNDKGFVQCAGALARRMMTEVHGGEKERAVYGFRLCVARAPREKELEIVLKLYRDNLAKYRKAERAAKEMASCGLAVPPGVDVAELAAWTVVANVLLNLDETITKG